MSHVERILGVLEALPVADRRWILQRLPSHLKSLLIKDVPPVEPEPTGAAIETSVESATATPTVEQLNPAIAAKILASEPLWVVEAVLRAGNAGWRKRVIRHLPPVARPTRATSIRSAQYLTKPVIDSLLQAMHRRAQLMEPDAEGSDEHRRKLVPAFIQRWLPA